MTAEVAGTYSATAGLPFDDQELESNLVWIWGSPRSGSTWLLEMLCHPLKMDPRSHVGFRWWPKWRGEAQALPVNEFQMSAHVGAAVFGGPPGDTMEDGETILPRTLNRQTDAFSSYAFSSEYEAVWRPEVRRLTLVRLHAVIERAREAGLNLPSALPLLVIKEVNGSQAADLMMSLFPRSRMILLLRDGRDVLDSILDANRADGWLTKWRGGEGGIVDEEDRLEWVRESCRSWAARMNVCERAYEAHDPGLRRRIRYEDLLADTPAGLAELFGWLGLPGGPARIEKIVEGHSFAAAPERSKGPGRLRRSATPGAWREGLTADEQAIAQEIIGRSLEALGYEQ